MNQKVQSAAIRPGNAITFSDPQIQQCPFRAYETLRKEQPVYKDPVTGHYVLTRYTDVRKVLIKHRAFSSNAGMVGKRESSAKDEIKRLYREKGWRKAPTFQLLDEPEHKAKRSLVDKAFAHWNIQAIHPYIEAVVNDLIDGFEGSGQGEFVTEFAAGLTMRVIAHQLGVVDDDPEQYLRDAAKLRVWSDRAVELISPIITRERESELALDNIEFQHFCADNIARVRAQRDDTLLSKLIEVVVGEDSEPDIPELLEMMGTILIAGNETTRFALAAGAKALIDDPALSQAIRDDPEKIEAFIEEVLRVMSPIQTLFRRATEDVEIDGVTIPAGSRIEVRYGAGNLDPAIYPDPYKIDLDRPQSQPHLAFGMGIHICIGMQLARAELRLAFKHLLRRLENLRAANGDDSYDYTPIYISWGLARLDLAFEQRAL